MQFDIKSYADSNRKDLVVGDTDSMDQIDSGRGGEKPVRELNRMESDVFKLESCSSLTLKSQVSPQKKYKQ